LDEIITLSWKWYVSDLIAVNFLFYEWPVELLICLSRWLVSACLHFFAAAVSLLHRSFCYCCEFVWFRCVCGFQLLFWVYPLWLFACLSEAEYI
jgi:hypothetical protein